MIRLLTSAYDEVYQTLVPYGTYLQYDKSTIVEGRVRGFPVEAAISLAAAIVIGSFFKSFFAELGRVSAQKALEKITSNIKSKRKFDPETLNEIEDLIIPIKSEIGEYQREKVKKVYLQAKKEMEKELSKTGIPTYKIEKISLKCSTILQAEIMKEDINHCV